MMQLTIKLQTATDSMTPDEIEKVRHEKGFARKVRNQIKAAKALDPESLWGWCTVIVLAIVEIEGVRLEGRDVLCGCSYTSELDFVKNSGYFNDMVVNAINHAIEQFNGTRAKAMLAMLTRFTE